MELGVAMFVTAYSIQPTQLAMEAEARGFASLWLPEHSHTPTSRKSPFPGGGDMPPHYYDPYDPFVALGAAAAVTTKIKIATGVCLVIQRDPIHTAKMVSSLDQISGGRFIFGVGAGWNAEEMANHGTAFATRAKLLRERVLAMKEIWTKDKAQFHGDLVQFDEMIQRPKPVQRPHPPVIVGGGYPHAARRAVAYGEGWMPIDGRELDVVRARADFHRMAAAAGRDPATLSFSVYGAPADRAALGRYRDIGVDHAVLRLPSEPAERILPLLDQYAALIR